MAAGLQGAEHPVAVALANADAFHLHMPVVGGAVSGIELDHLAGFVGVPVLEEQQLQSGGQGSHHGEIHPPGGDAGPQRPRPAEVHTGRGARQRSRANGSNLGRSALRVCAGDGLIGGWQSTSRAQVPWLIQAALRG